MKPTFDRNEINAAINICNTMMTYYFGLKKAAEPDSCTEFENDEKQATWHPARELFLSLMEAE